jgi:hypothetical protein
VGAKAKLLHSEIAQARKRVGIGHMYIYYFLLRMTNAMISQNIDISSWDTLYRALYRNRKNIREIIWITIHE